MFKFIDWVFFKVEVEWHRFNIWLDARNEFPGCKISVSYDRDTGKFIVLRSSGLHRMDSPKGIRLAEESKARWEHKTKLWTPEQHAAHKADTKRKVQAVMDSMQK